jgi:hypothetical protein
MPNGLPDDVVDSIRAAIFAGQKIQAIKLHREATGYGLKESKDFIESLEAELRSREPERFTAPPGGKGCAGVALLVVIVTLTVSTATLLAVKWESDIRSMNESQRLGISGAQALRNIN